MPVHITDSTEETEDVGRDSMILRRPTIEQHDGYVYLASAFDLPGGGGELWMRASGPTADYFRTDVADPFLLPALLVAMEAGVDIRSEAPVSDILLQNLNAQVRTILRIQNRSLAGGRIFADPVASGRRSASGVGTGLSCGIDSFAAIHTHFLAGPPSSLALTHLAQFSHDQARGEENRWAENLSRFRRVAVSLGLPLIEVGTNFRSVVNLPHTMAHTYLNCACVLALDGLIRQYYYASTFSYRDVHVRQTNAISRADPIVLPLISNGNVRLQSTGAEIRRPEKTALVAEVPASWSALEVCPKRRSGTLNCSRCYKCKRTMLTLNLLGRLGRYKGVFRLKTYRELRASYAERVLATLDDPYMTEIRNMPGAKAKLRKWAKSASGPELRPESDPA